MSANLSRVELWLDATIRQRALEARLAAVWHVVVCLFACIVWWVCVVGTLYGLWFILAFAGIRIPYPPLVGLAVFAFQFGLFRFVRRPEPPRWEVGHDLDGEIVVTPPDHAGGRDYAYNQDHDFSFRRVYIGLFFAGPIALDEARREWRKPKRLSRLEREPAAQLAAILLDEQRKLSFGEIRERWLGAGLKEAIDHAAFLPGFQMFSRDPQGMALTDGAKQELLAD